MKSSPDYKGISFVVRTVLSPFKKEKHVISDLDNTEPVWYFCVLRLVISNQINAP